MGVDGGVEAALVEEVVDGLRVGVMVMWTNLRQQQLITGGEIALLYQVKMQIG